jgi:PST family polysaccharide transporter
MCRSCSEKARVLLPGSDNKVYLFFIIIPGPPDSILAGYGPRFSRTGEDQASFRKFSIVTPAYQSIIKSLRNNRRLFSNAFYLYIYQGLIYLLPLITIPYLVRVLKTDTFGKIAFYGAFMTYFQIILDYGFNLSATRDASLAKNDARKLSNLFFSVFLVKLAMALVCAATLAVLILAVPRFQTETRLCIWLFLGIAGSILFPTWLFQGMEEMRYISIFNLVSRVAATGFYFIQIKKPADYLWYAYLNSGSTLIVGLVAFFVALHKFRIMPVLPGLNQCRSVLANGFQIFISQASVTLFTNTNIFLLGLFTNNIIVGKYAVADKIVRAVISLTGPVGTAIYPRTAVLFSQSREVAMRFLRKVIISGGIVFGLASIALFLSADLLVLMVTGSRSAEIAAFIRIMSILPLSVFFDNIYGTQIMLNVNLQKQFMRIILTGGIFSVLFLIVLVPPLKGIGSAITFLLSELIILSLMFIVVRKTGIHLWRTSNP